MSHGCWPLLLALFAPAPADVPPKALEGRWAIETTLYQKQAFAPATGLPLLPSSFEIRRATLRVRLSGAQDALADLTVDDSVLPKQFEVWLNGGHVMRGIYALDGDILVVCFPLTAGRMRPKTFSTLLDDRTILFVLHRQT